MELNLFLIVFIILVISLTIFFPISGYYEMRKLKKSFAEGENHKKIKFYNQQIIWSWILILPILILIPLSGMKIENIGIKWIDIEIFSISKWLLLPAIGFYLVYLLYNTYLIILYKYNRKSRAQTAKGLIDDFKWFLPITIKEKRRWSWLSITAGITEEILYRGYFFYALAIIFPNLTKIHILLIATLIFGVGHIYLGKEVIKSTLLGLFLGIFYLIFDSIIPVIIIHILQDLVLRDILEEET